MRATLLISYYAHTGTCIPRKEKASKQGCCIHRRVRSACKTCMDNVFVFVFAMFSRKARMKKRRQPWSNDEVSYLREGVRLTALLLFPIVPLQKMYTHPRSSVLEVENGHGFCRSSLSKGALGLI